MDSHYWFAKKKNGRGWTAPASREGSLAIGLFLAIFLLDIMLALAAGSHSWIVIPFVLILALDVLWLLRTMRRHGEPL